LPIAPAFTAAAGIYLVRNRITGSTTNSSPVKCYSSCGRDTTINSGLNIGLTVIVNVVVVAHCPASGVNV
jgi:hypothetical protein